MKLFWQQNKIIIVFLILLTGATVYSFVDDMTEEEPIVLSKLLSEPDDYQTFVKKNNLRSPSSIVEKKTEAQDQKLAIIAFCDPKTLHLKSTTHLLMLELTSCLPLKEKYLLRIKNETNGFKAQVFKVNSKKFKTDFIQLNQGINKILLEGVLKDGQKIVQTLEILSAS